MKRYSIVPKIGDGLTTATAFRPNLPDSANPVTVCEMGSRYLVVHHVPDGTVEDTDTILDLLSNGGFDAKALTNAQRTTIKNRLQTLGYDVSQFDTDVPVGSADRAKLLRFVVKRLGNRLDLTDADLGRLGANIS